MTETVHHARSTALAARRRAAKAVRRQQRRRRATATGVALAVSVAGAGVALAYVTGSETVATAKGGTVSGAQLTAKVGPGAGSLAPGQSVTLPVTITNRGPYALRVNTIRAAEITMSAAGCPTSAVQLTGLALDPRGIAVIGPQDSRQVTVPIMMAVDAPDSCQGTQVRVSLAVSGRSA